LDIFNEEHIVFETEFPEIISKIDRTQLIRIITNLVKNAIQSIPPERSKRVIVTVKKLNSNVLISVEDNGVGIKPQDIGRIFEPKFTTKSSGMGLGLGIIKNIIENYKGTITFETALAKGTKFTVSLPIINS
jgi:signal transduction histidine kinase